MEIRKCAQCGGNLKHMPLKRVWVCPYCGAQYEETAIREKENPDTGFGLNEDVFEVEADLSKIMKSKAGQGFIKSVIYCMESFQTAKDVEEYMLGKLSFSDDIAMGSVREEYIRDAMPVIGTVLDPGERVILYENKGLLSKGKEYLAITDKRSIFVRKKRDVETVLHTDLDSLMIRDFANCYLNDDFDKGIINLDGDGRFQGAVIALICMLSFEADPDRGKIRIL